MINGGQIEVRRDAGKLSQLIDLVSKTPLNGAQVSQIPTFEFPAGNPNQGVRMTSFDAFASEHSLDLSTISRILIPKDDKTRAWNAVSPQLPD